MEWLGQVFSDAVSWLWQRIVEGLTWILDGLLFILKGFAFFFIDGMLTIFTTLINALDYSAVAFQWAAGKALLPPQAIYFICAIGFPQFAAIVTSAYVLRFVMNLIPSVAGTGFDKL